MNMTTNGTAPGAQRTRRENVVAGIVGAFLGSLIGVVCIVLLGQLGYVASVSGLVMAVCALKGYEKLGGVLSKKGAAFSAVLILVMTYLANRLDWAISVAEAFDAGILTAFGAIDYLLEEEVIEGGSYWGNLVMLYIFTLMGAVPTIISSLRGDVIPDPPLSVELAPEEEGAEEPTLQVYAPQKGWMTPLRVSAIAAMFFGIVVGGVLMAVGGGDATLSLAAVGAIFSSVIMICVALPTVLMCNAAGDLLVRREDTLWRVDLNGLNAVNGFRFTNKVTGNAMWTRMSTEEQERAVESAGRAISACVRGLAVPGSMLSQAVVPLVQMKVEKETKWAWKITYLDEGNKRRTRNIPKAYEDFAPYPEMKTSRTPPPAKWSLCVIALVLTALLALACGAVGQVGEEDPSPIRGQGKGAAVYVTDSVVPPLEEII